MKIFDILEAITPVGSTTMSQPQAGTVTGNTQQLTDPALQAAQLAKQKQEKEKQKQDLMMQIKAKQAELQALQKQQMDLNKTV